MIIIYYYVLKEALRNLLRTITIRALDQPLISPLDK